MPDLVIDGERFAAAERLEEWALMKLAKSQTSGNNMISLAGMYDFVNAVVLPEERERLDAYLSSHQLPPGALNEAVGTLVEGYANRPTERPSSSPGGPPATGQRSRVVSLSRGTVRVDEASSTDAASSAS